MTRVKIETEVDLSPDLMAKVFARMTSDQQAYFLSTCWHELLEACEGAAGAARQLAYVYGEATFDDDARELIEHLSPLPDEKPKHNATQVAIVPETSAGVKPSPASRWPVMIFDDPTSRPAFPDADEMRRQFVAAYGSGDQFRTATEELSKREALAREVAARIPHVASRFNVERMQSVHDSYLMDAYAEIDILDGAGRFDIGDRYALDGMAIGTVIAVDPGMPGEERTVTVRLDAVLPDLQPCAVPPTCGERFDNIGPNYGGPTYRQPSTEQAEARANRVCPECKGTGWYEGFAKRERCSRGCACR